MTPPEHPVSVTALDKYTVEIKGTPGWLQPLFEATYSFLAVLPPEPIEKWGDKAYIEWENSVGTGPFMLTDFVGQSSATFVRNPNYWAKDPMGAGKGNQLPYLDGAKMLIIADISTQEAALRTAKIDYASRVLWEKAEYLMQTTPELKYREELPANPNVLYMRTDNSEQPWYDIKVRRAMQMAIDAKGIKDDYFGGNAIILAYPGSPFPMYKAHYTPLEEQSDLVKELFSYQPEKAKQMLAEAGYPDGFKIEVIAQARDVDLLSLVKAYFADININLEIEVKERAVYTSLGRSRSHKEGYFGTAAVTTPYAWHLFQPDDYTNKSMVDDPFANETQANFSKIYVFDEPKAAEYVNEFYKYALEQAWVTALPGPYTFTMWWPWVKNYHGEWIVGYTRPYNFPTWIWLDQDLKKEMGH